MGDKNDTRNNVVLNNTSFSHEEKSNIILYILGIMCFKFAFESLGSSISLMAQARFSKEFALTMTPVLTSCFNIMQCICSIAAAQLLTRFRTNVILAFSMFCFAIFALILIIIDASTGGKLPIDGSKFSEGHWSPWILFPIYLPMGGCLGVLELVRRVLPRDIVGENPEKLKKMDANVHIFYEIAGTAGAFASAATIKKMGPVYALILIPILFTAAGFIWLKIKHNPNAPSDINRNLGLKSSDRGSAFYLFFYSVKRGAQIVFSERRFIWLIPGYVLPFVFHRFIENVIFPTFAKQVLNEGSYSGILLGGSNFGELLGAFSVLLLASKVYTPLPFVRFDAVALMTLWIFPYLPVHDPLKWALYALPLMIVLSSGWAAGDVSLVAYIQSRLHSVNINANEGTSPLGCVMAFLYSSYIITFTILSIPLGRVFDSYKAQGRTRESFLYIAGVMMTIGAVIIFACTFIPRHSFAINPKVDPDDVVAEETDNKNDEKGPANLVEAISMA
ncbi:major facilitator superfamily domain-containing protein [Glomus cerebriforme]|uniref:Major facilitator superfamily domain-containing protein n=1 Tax=Glomus cerebriforme TaxID=658196 RepID=A0A397TG14_9GLOM|nr:major facilitator superfamily domain-containing protein [Glomus cerebriforme]